MARTRTRATTEDRIVDGVIWVVMLLVFLVTAYPFYYIVIQSLNEGVDALRGGVYLFPRAFTLDNYALFLRDASWLAALRISVLRTLIGAVTCVLFTCLVAYGMSHEDLALRKLYMGVFIVCMLFDGGLIPYYLTLKQVKLLNTFLVYILPNAFSIYNMFLAISFFREIPKELHESALLDGAGHMRIYASIVLPLSMPLLATLALFSAVGQWNSWMDTAFYNTSAKHLYTLAYLMRDVIMRNQTGALSGAEAAAAAKRSTSTSTSVQMAAMIIGILPILCVYPFLQRYFVKGIMLGAVKG